MSRHKVGPLYQYPYPHPAIAADIAVFTVMEGVLRLLLIKRKEEPFKGMWALPGGFLREDEDLDACAARELQEETGVTGFALEHFGNFSEPDRDPRERVVSVSYLALVPSSGIRLRSGTDAAEARWFSVHGRGLPPLAFDHALIVGRALERLAANAERASCLLPLLPEEFTLAQLQDLMQTVLGSDKQLDKRNFRRRVLAMELLIETDNFEHGSHRPARLFRARRAD